jgi:hypothetical protein
MFREYKISVVIPSGRKQYMECLLIYLKSYTIIDEIQIWVNTLNKDDLEYLENLKHEKIKLIKLPIGRFFGRSFFVCNFYKFCKDKDTVYVKCDDDIVWCDTEDRFKDFLNFRIDNPQYFVVSANVINNQICDHLRNFQYKKIEYPKNFNNQLKNHHSDKNFYKLLHSTFEPKVSINKHYFDNHEALCDSRIHINFISWMGTEFRKFNGIVGGKDELWINRFPYKIEPYERNDTVLETNHEKCNAVFGNFLVVHFAFEKQREMLSNSEHDTLLNKYKTLSNLLKK